MSTYSVDYFLKKFQSIPEELFIEYTLEEGARRCANGWCGVRTYQFENRIHFSANPESKGLQVVFSALSSARIHDHSENHSDIAAYINNGDDSRYQQDTPKQRILAALQDIKKLQEEQIGKKHINITSSLAVLPPDEKADTLHERVLVKENN